ncbi:apolipoprotein n-acyltransferase [Moniliophthora roreri]|nr:apolipoprotein n-acyltransferase [Moniliophthora roreri]
MIQGPKLGEFGPLATSRFVVYDRIMAESVGNARGELKSDALLLLGCDDSLINAEGKLHDVKPIAWDVPLGSVEIKADNMVLFKHVSTYLRALRSRGLRALTDLMFAMSLKTLCQLGCDHAFFRITQSGPEIIFPSSSNHISSSYQLHPLEPVLCERIGAIGRSTVAGVISDTHSEALKTGSPEVEVMEGASYSKRKLPDAAASKEATLSQPTKKQRTSVSSVTPIRSRQGDKGGLMCLHLDLHAAPNIRPLRNICPSMNMSRAGSTAIPFKEMWFKVFNSGQRPLSGVFKRSFPTTNHVMIEKEALKVVAGMHGHADKYQCVSFNRSFEEWVVISSSVKPIDLLHIGHAQNKFDIESRLELVVLTPTIGRTLRSCESPRQLPACSSASVSLGNLLTRSTPQDRTRDGLNSRKNNLPWMRCVILAFDDQLTHTDSYFGFTISADLAVRWQANVKPGKDRSGTLPYIPIRTSRPYNNG